MAGPMGSFKNGSDGLIPEMDVVKVIFFSSLFSFFFCFCSPTCMHYGGCKYHRRDVLLLPDMLHDWNRFDGLLLLYMRVSPGRLLLVGSLEVRIATGLPIASKWLFLIDRVMVLSR